MALTSSSTLADALAQYNNNLAWDGDATVAALALEAVRWLLVNRPQSIAQEGRTINYAVLETQQARLEHFVNKINTSSRSSFVRARMLT